jgi:hypothetical protein
VNDLPFRPLVRLPDNLTVRFGREPLTTGDPRAWCQQKAADLLGPQAPASDVKRLARSLEEHLEFFRKDMPLIVAAVCFYPNYRTVPPRAMVKVEAFGGAPDGESLTMDKVREFYAKPDHMSFGETELTEPELPVGQALRVHRYRKTDPGKRRTKIMEEVVWVVWPRGSTFAIAIATRWLEPWFGKAGATIADSIAKDFRVEPWD